MFIHAMVHGRPLPPHVVYDLGIHAVTVLPDCVTCYGPNGQVMTSSGRIHPLYVAFIMFGLSIPL